MNITVNPTNPARTPQPPPPPQPKRSGLKIFTILLTLFLVASLIGNVVLFLLVIFVGAAAGGDGAGPAAKITSITLRAGSRDKIAIMPLEGTVNDSMTERVHAFCEYIKQDSTIRGVVLAVDSPGGGITASDEIHHLLTDLKTANGINRKLVVSMRSLAASGGYYISMPAEKIYAEKTTLTGSIGVIWPAFEVAGLMKNIGVTPEIIKSDSSDAFKDAGSPFKPFTETDRLYIKGLVNNAQERFSQVVDEGRKGKLAPGVTIKQIAVGKIFTADDALKLGLIDEIAYPDVVYTNTATELGIADPTIIRLAPHVTLLEALTAKTSGSPKVELKVDPETLNQLSSPKLQYRTQFP